jgi:hypothetical protein
MRTLGFSLLLTVVVLAGCATAGPPPLSAADVVAMSKDGKSAEEIIAELKRTETVLALRASDFVALHDAGVPDEVLNYLQLALIEEIRWRERSLYYGPGWGGYYGWGPCLSPYRGRWGC